MRATEFIAELFEPKAPTWKWVFRGSEEATADFKVGDVPYRFYAYSNGENDWEVEFKINSNEYDQNGKIKFGTKFGLAGTGNSAEVMSTVVDIMREFLEMYRGKIDTIGFTAEEPSRQKLYMRMMKRLLPNWTISTYDSGSGLGFTVVAPDNLEEEINLQKNQWELLISSSDKQEAGPELVDLVKHAYSVTPKGSMIQSLKDVIPSDWNVIDWDQDPDIDACVFYRKNRQGESWVGYKIQGLGHDGTRQSKDKAIHKMLDLLKKPGVWIESSDALRHVLHKMNAPSVKDERFLQQLFNDQSLHMVQDDTYRRTLHNGQEIQETVFGQPKLK